MAEKKVIELEVKENLGNLRQQLKQAQVEVQTLADKFGATSDQAREAAKRAAELKDRIGDAKALTDSFNPDAKFKGLGQALTGVAGGFAAVQGAMALVGNQSEEVEKTLLKVQSAMALAAGIDQLTEAKDAFVNLGKTAVKAFESIKGAIGATGIGLLVVALGVIYAYWEDISKAVGFSTKESEKYAKQQKIIGEQAKKQSEEVAKESGAFATLISRLKATNQNTKEREELIKKINTQYGTTLKNIKDERNFQEQLNTELASYLEYQKAKYSLQKNEDLIVKNLEKQDEINRKLRESQKNLNKAIEEGAGLKRKGKVDIEDKFVQDILVNEQATKIAETERENIKKLIKEQEKAEQRFESYGEAAQKASVKVGILTNEGTKYVEQIKKDEPKVTEVVKKEKEEQLVLTRKHSSTVITDIVSEGTKRLEAEKVISDKSIEIAKAEAEQKAVIQQENLDIASKGIGLIKGLFEKSKGLQKAAVIAESAIGIAKMIIATRAGNIAARSSGTALSIATGGASVLAAEAQIARNNISTGIGIAANIAATAKALNALGGGGAPSGSAGGGGGGGGATAPNMSAPQFNVVGQSGVNQLASLNQQPIQAYVVSGQVTSQQALDRNRLANATLGG